MGHWQCVHAQIFQLLMHYNVMYVLVTEYTLSKARDDTPHLPRPMSLASPHPTRAQCVWSVCEGRHLSQRAVQAAQPFLDPSTIYKAKWCQRIQCDRRTLRMGGAHHHMRGMMHATTMAHGTPSGSLSLLRFAASCYFVVHLRAISGQSLETSRALSSLRNAHTRILS